MPRYSEGTASISSSGDHNVVELTDGITTNNIFVGGSFRFIGDPKLYDISKVVDETTFELSERYFGSKTLDEPHSYVASFDITPNAGFGELLPTDVDTAEVFTATVRQVENLFSGLNNVVSSNIILNNRYQNTFVENGDSNVSVVLPSASTVPGQIFTVAKTDPGSGQITVYPFDSSQTIDGEASYLLSGENSSVTFMSDGTNWFIIATASPDFVRISPTHGSVIENIPITESVTIDVGQKPALRPFGFDALAIIESVTMRINPLVPFVNDTTNIIEYADVGHVLAYVGVLLSPSGTGVQSYTSVPFRPKTVLFFTSGLNGTTSTVAQHSMGAATSSSARWAVCQTSDFVSNSRVTRTDRCILHSSIAATILEADFSAFADNGFSLNWSKTTANVPVFFLALGGSKLSAHAGSFDASASTGNQSVTGVGFQPKTVLFAAARADTSETFDNSLASLSFGTGISSSSRWAVSTARSSTTARSHLSTTLSGLRTNTAGGTAQEFDFVSHDSDGFTVNNVVATATRWTYLALGGSTLVVKAGIFNQPTSTGNQSVTGVGFKPTVTIFASRSKANGASEVDGKRMTGVARTSTERATIAYSTTSTASGAAASGRSNRCIEHVTGTTSVTVNSSADFVSHDNDGFTINWVTADATARENLFICLGNPVTFGHQVTAFDVISIAEHIIIQIGSFAAFVFDSISINESVIVILSGYNLSVFDSISIAENITIVFDGYNISVFDSISTAENVTVIVGGKKINVNDVLGDFVNAVDFINVVRS